MPRIELYHIVKFVARSKVLGQHGSIIFCQVMSAAFSNCTNHPSNFRV